jgi:uncharacterized protein
MLPLQLLRIRIKDKGKNISPVFCEYKDRNSSELHLATKIIEEFEETCKKKEKKGVLGERVARWESQYDDYKLVRGFYTLLERRCVFSNVITGTPNLGSNTTKSFDANIASNIHPFAIRRELFEESSKRGFALSDGERTEIMNVVASRLGLSTQEMTAGMWSDLEENMVLNQFYKITPEELIAWYNLSLMQTLLFNCTKVEFSVNGGSNWKRVLRDVKRLGLMYNLQHRKEDEHINDMQHTRDIGGYEFKARNNAIIFCSIDGPLSIFKLTDRYGTAIAKLVPSIVSADSWSIRAWIVRKTISSGKKMYEFEISDKESPSLRDPYRDGLRINNGKEEFPSYDRTPSNIYFDSSVEEKFANKFEQSVTGWNLIREPDPLILSTGKALIPDFMFEKYGRKIYLEIVGFWTSEYLERKLNKIIDVTKSHNNDNIDFFIAINNDYYTSPNNMNNRGKISKSQTLSSFVDKNHLLLYKNDNVPLRPILEYLKAIELEMVEKYATHNYNDLLSHLDNIIANSPSNDVISIHEIAKKYNIPIESALRIIRSQDNSIKDNSYIIADKYLIPKSKADELESLLIDIRKFNEACSLFAKNNIPESCHMDLLSKLGYDIIWKGIDSNSATIERIF